MADFEFLENPLIKKWVILAPRRAKRPDVSKGTEPVCPFCPGRERDEQEVYRVSSNVIADADAQSHSIKNEMPDQVRHDNKEDWLVRVLPNKFPFAPIHEVIIHSPDHHKNFDEFPQSQTELVFKTYRQRYNIHKDRGQVYIFHNRGEGGGESLPHPHSQLAVVPFGVKMDILRLDPVASSTISPKPILFDQDTGQTQTSANSETPNENNDSQTAITKCFYIFCPRTSQWPDEVWIAPNKRGRAFGEITDEEISDLSVTISRLIQIMDFRHGHEFPFNFYIYPGGDWYLRLIPRVKMLGGFEIGTGVYVNTQDPKETIDFIKKHLNISSELDVEKIKKEYPAEYERTV